MKAIIRKSLPAALAATLVAGAAVTIPAIATTEGGTEESTTESTESTEDTADTDHRGPFGRIGHHLAHGLEEGELAERLAAELDLDTATVQDAIDAVRSDLAAERLAEAVEAGRLTQDQADRIAAAIEAGDTDALREVWQEVRLEKLEARLAEKVEAGELTQEEADEILERAEEGDFPFRRGRRGHHPGHRGLGFGLGDADTSDAAADTTST